MEWLGFQPVESPPPLPIPMVKANFGHAEPDPLLWFHKSISSAADPKILTLFFCLLNHPIKHFQIKTENKYLPADAFSIVSYCFPLLLISIIIIPGLLRMDLEYDYIRIGAIKVHIH